MAEQIDILREGLTGHYEVDRAVGQGGMATVYLARDIRNERKVAIKVLKPELAASIGHERFLREIKLASQLQHPNILGMYESGEVQGLVYYSMPFIEGESLRDRIDKEKQLPIEEAVRIVREAGEALGYAHAHGVVHRDIKPENILLMNGHALVADFGIAKAVEAAGGEKLTETGMAVGTPHYMSPEQALGGSIDGRSDQYSLACVLYECLIGQTPFDGPSPMAVLARHAMEQVPSMQVVRNAIPDSVEDVVFRAMEKTPADRYPSMKEFCEALEDAEADVHVARTAARRAAQGGPRTASYRAQTGAVRRATTPIEIPVSAKKSKVPMIAGGAVALLALLGGGFFFMKGRGTAAPPPTADALADAKRIAVLYFEDQSPNHSLGYLTDGLTEELIKELSTVQGLEVTSRNGVGAYRDPAIPRDSVAKALNVGTIVVGSVEPAGADKVRVTARLVDASGTEIKRSSFEQGTGDPLAMSNVLAGRVAEFLRERLGEEVRVRQQQASTKSPAAWSLLQRAERARTDAEVAVARNDTSGIVQKELGEADSLAKLAGEQDPQWNAPLVLRGQVAYRRSRLTGADAMAARPFIDQGMALARTAVERNPADPDALELRGTLQYWRYLLRLDPEKDRPALLASARKDLEDAKRINPLQAGAWGTLSHLYYQTGSTTDVLLAARRAYEADAYLTNANVILSRLFLASYDLGQEVDAQQACEESQRRFPNDPKSTSCQLFLMTMRGQEPDVARGWKLATSDAVKNDPATGSPEYTQRQARMLMAAVLAKAGLKDSAKAVVKQAHAGTDVDPTRDLSYYEAFALGLAGDKEGAVTALKTYLAANPDKAKDLATDPGWWFRDLANDPGFKAAVGAK